VRFKGADEVPGEIAIANRRQVALAPWTAADVPPQIGKFAVITGGCSGLGLETALALAQAGADVLLADVDAVTGREAVAFLRMHAPAGLIRHEILDLGSLASIRQLAKQLRRQGRPIDLLINNAGVMALPRRATTAEGFEMHFGVNFLGHFALTAQLLPLLSQTRLPRVVQVSSVISRHSSIQFDDLQSARKYRRWQAYAQSKLALILFALELQRRSDANGWRLQSNAVHPGYARTGIFLNGPGPLSLINMLHLTLGRALSQSAAQGALPILFAATAPKARMGAFYGPRGPFELLGLPGEAEVPAPANDLEVAGKLWNVATELTGVTWKTE
jgi:NAD(P)-dependent dehydrogenase (short-subunit alcohol dehydrogenase family)